MRNVLFLDPAAVSRHGAKILLAEVDGVRSRYGFVVIREVQKDIEREVRRTAAAIAPSVPHRFVHIVAHDPRDIGKFRERFERVPNGNHVRIFALSHERRNLDHDHFWFFNLTAWFKKFVQ